MLRERDRDGFSNSHGIQEMRFERGHIREVTGEALAVIERELGTRRLGRVDGRHADRRVDVAQFDRCQKEFGVRPRSGRPPQNVGPNSI